MNTCHAPQSVPVAEQERLGAERPAGEAERKERDGRGRFVPGNGGGPGNPFGRRVAELRKRMLAAISDEVIDELILKAIELGRGGDLAAIKFVVQYCVGRSGQTANPDRVDVEEWRLAQESAVSASAWHELFQQVPVEAVHSVNRIAWACQGERFRQFMKEGLDARRPNDETPADESDGETDGRPEEAHSTSAPRDRKSAPSANGGNGKRHRAAVGSRANGAAAQKGSSSTTGHHGKHGAPSTKAGNGNSAAARRAAQDLRAALLPDDAEGDCWPTDVDPADDDGRPSIANLLAGLPPETLAALARDR